MTEIAAGSLAARRRRAIARRSATLAAAEVSRSAMAQDDLAGVTQDDLAGVAQNDLAGVARTDLGGAAAPPGADQAVGTADLVVLLPSADAATVLLLCAQAAEPSS